jgi:PleD family two-component response regulator
MSSIRNCRVADLLGDRSVTASIGVVELNKKHESIEAALHDADLGLYEAKRTGRDKICVTGVKKKKAA